MTREYAKYIRTGKDYDTPYYYYIIEKLTDREAKNTIRHLEQQDLSKHFTTISIY